MVLAAQRDEWSNQESQPNDRGGAIEADQCPAGACSLRTLVVYYILHISFTRQALARSSPAGCDK